MPTVGRQVVRALVAAVEEAGVPRAEYLRAIGLREADLHELTPRVPLRDVIRYCERALAADPALGLHWGESLNERAFAPVSHLLTQASTLRRGFESVAQFERLLYDERTYEIVEAASEMSIRVINVARFPPQVSRFIAEVTLAGMFTTVRAFSVAAKPLVARFAYAPPPYRAEYERVFTSAVRFGQPVTELVFERSLLDRLSPQRDVEVHAALRMVAEERLLRLTRNAPYAMRLRHTLLVRSSRRLTMAGAAQDLGLSVRSLRRKLALEGTSYREVEYDALRTLAERLLCDQGLTIQETAYAMGFSEVTTFHRAFKNWTNVSPGVFREKLQATRRAQH
jgi:AraC-like DNA-binding protein